LLGEVAWCNNLKTIVDGYPKVFLTLSGHDPTGTANMTRIGNRQEIFFDRQTTPTGAASVRIYTFNLSSMRVNTQTYAYNATSKAWSWLTDAYNQFSFNLALNSNDWTLVTTQSVKAYPNLTEFIWQKTPAMQPNGPYDIIGLHRLVKNGTATKGVVFITSGGTGSGKNLISNPPADNFAKTESFGIAFYLANRGFDVYSIDERRQFIPITFNTSQVSFMKDWGWDVLMSDYREAVLKTKEVSGASKVFMMGLGTGAIITKNYASEFGKQDLRGMILLSPQNMADVKPTNTYNLTKAVNDMIATGSWSKVNLALQTINSAKSALENPGGPAPVSPAYPVNPITNKPWTNITEFLTYVLHNSAGFGGPGGLSNLLGGYGNLTELLYNFANATVYLPTRLDLENTAMADWVNCPYITYDFNDHYKEVDLPSLTIAAGLYKNATGQFQFVNEFASPDFTTIYLANYGVYDVYFGNYNVRDVNASVYQWLLSHYQPPAASAFSSATVMTGQNWSFVVHSNGGVSSHRYQWYEGTTSIAGKTDAVLTISKATAGTYTFYCRVTDAEGATADSNTVTLTVK
jgi:hypothetical protein